MSVAPGTEGIKKSGGVGGGAVNLGASLRVSLNVMHTGFISVGVVCMCVASCALSIRNRLNCGQ